MDIFTYTYNSKEFLNSILENLNKDGFLITYYNEVFNIENDFFKNDKGENQKIFLTKHSTLNSDFEEYDKEELDVLLSILKYPYYYFDITYKIGTSTELLYAFIDTVNKLILNNKINNHVIVEDDSFGIFMKFNDFIIHYNKKKEFFHAENYINRLESNGTLL